ncbi:o-succinylbenzoate synthase [Gordonia defluvii]|uniref:o-succinylbenzoate synthase n=1 Tax=Gordonia defluvii TaxID=283718 RepID=A0ABP6LIX6_9ACTN
MVKPGPPVVLPLPALGDLLATAVVVALPMRVRFRGIAVREAMLFRGPAGWGEFSPFIEYGDEEASAWLAAGIEAAWLGPPPAVRDAVEVNATVPAVPASQVAGVLARFPGARTAKVKVAERGQSLRDDIERVAAVRDLVDLVRVDANGGWRVDQAVAAIGQLGELEYVEQPCATVEELAQVRRRVSAPVAADESIRKADDPLRVVAAGAADIAVVKVAPLGGMRRVLELAEQIPLPIVVSSALDTAVGIGAGVAAAAALPGLDHACGLGTGALFADDVTADPPAPRASMLTPTAVIVADPPLAAPDRELWWRQRLARCHALLATPGRHQS